MNATLTTTEVFAQQLKSRSTAIQVTESVFILLINFASFAGNLLLGIAVIKNPNLRRTVPNMYIITLAVSDFLMSLLGIPFSAASLIVGEWPFNNFVCQLQGFWILLMCAASLQTLAVTAVNRYFRVVRSRALYQKLFNMKTTKITIAIVWIMAFFAPLPYVASGHEFFFHTGKVFCAHDAESLYHGYGAYLVLVYVAIPLIIIITCYTRVFIAVRKHNLKFRLRFRARSQSNAPTESSLSVDEINITYILLVVVIGFLTCWTPVMVIDMIDFINADWKLKRQVYVSYTCFGFASTSLNPVIYGIMNRSFRAEYLRILAPLKIWSSQTASVVRADDNHDDNGDEARNNHQSLTRNKVGVSFEIDERKPSEQSKVVQCERSRLYRANSWAGKRDAFSIKLASTHSL
ncbi:melatonin receptor [Desmophyllum pertusum]|uniref:Melatonin receptor n=1 Tax=Desmophyllum pertusum TaxID=174260 RepID=A0A9X0CQL1_9CNID|nr:melatonin receptor [Desmophyllum pertusum]